MLGDDTSQPAIGTTEAKRLISQEKVDVLTGCLSSGVGLAVSATAEENGVFFLAIGTHDTNITGPKANKVTFRTTCSNAMLANAVGPALVKKGTVLQQDIGAVAFDKQKDSERVGRACFGIVQGGPVAAIHSSTTAILLNNAGTVTVPGSSGFTVSGISGSAGTAYFYVNAAFTKFWVSIDAGAGGATWQDGSGTNKTTAQIVAGTGGYTTGGLTGPFDAFFEFYSAGNTGVASLIPIASWPAAAPTGAVDITGGLATKLLPATPGGEVSAVFTCPNTTSGTIECSLTGTSGWFSAGGGNSGAGGTLTAGTEPTGQQGLATTYYFRDSGNTANQGIPQLLFSITPPSGVGSLVATDSLLLRGVTQPSTTYSFTGGADTKIYVAAAFPGGK